MLKLTLTLVTLTAFHGALGSPIPVGNTIPGVTNLLSGTSGSLSGVGDTAGIDALFGSLSARQEDDDELLPKRQLGIPIVGSAAAGLPVVGSAGSILSNIPVIGSLAGGTLKKRQLDGMLGGLLGGGGGLLGGGGGDGDDDGDDDGDGGDEGDDGDDEVPRKRQLGIPIVGSAASGLPVVGSAGTIASNLPVIGSLAGLSGVGSLAGEAGGIGAIGGDAGDDLTSAEGILPRSD